MRREIGFLGPDVPVAFAAGFVIVHFFRWIGLSNKIFNYWLSDCFVFPRHGLYSLIFGYDRFQ